MSLQEIRGELHDGQTTRRHTATLRVYAEGTVQLEDAEGTRVLRLADLRVPERLGDTPRRIELPDGTIFETDDNAAVDRVLDTHGPRHHGWLHGLENRLGAVAIATLCLLLLGGLFAVRGVPAIARGAAFAISPEISATLAEGTLDLLDQTFDPTELSDERQAELRDHFDALLTGERERNGENAYAFELLFRGGGALGANAFALPSGTIVMTDELVALAEHDEELIGVLAHEIGHVVHRHGLRSAIQSSLLLVGIVLLTGDLSSTSSVVAALPTLLAEARFSRDFEREADAYALTALRDANIEPSRLGDLLQRLSGESGGIEIPFIASHPPTDERIESLGSTP